MSAGNFFGGAFFGGGFFGAIDTAKTGTGGIDPGGAGQRRVPFKPTGLQEKKNKSARKGVQDRIDDGREIQAEIAEKLAREFGEETLSLPKEGIKPAVEMSLSEVEWEIGLLLRKKMKTQEDEILILLLMAASAA